MSELKQGEGKHVLTSSTLLHIDDQYYETEILASKNTPTFLLEDAVNVFNGASPYASDQFKINDAMMFKSSIAYLSGEYYYLYRGQLSQYSTFDILEPGIYYDDEKCEYVFVHPETEEEEAKYKYNDKITTLDAEEIRKAVLNKEVIIFNTPDATHSPIPPESMSDDILKRIIKRAISKKGIDLDQYKSRFASKNMLFNTKQVLRGPNKLSILLFDRCAEALNLKYTIILEECGGETVGIKLDNKIIIASDDTYESMNPINVDE